MMFGSKKGISVVLAILLMVLVAAVMGSALMFWFQSFQSEWTVKQQVENEDRDLEILGIQYINNERALVGIKNTGGGYHIVNKVEINDQICDVVGTNVVDTVANLFVDCPAVLDENYEVSVFSDQTVESKTFTSFEVGTNLQLNYADSNLTVTFRNALSCQPWETELYAMAFINNSHAEIPSSDQYSYSVCVNHTLYTLGNTCTGAYSQVFQVGATSDSHIYFDNTTAQSRANYYDWNPICLTAIGANEVQTNLSVSQPTLQHACVGSYTGTASSGYMVGDCTAYASKIWVRVY